MAEHIKSAFRLGVQRALAVASTPSALSKKLEDDLPLFAEDDVAEDLQGEEGNL